MLSKAWIVELGVELGMLLAIAVLSDAGIQRADQFASAGVNSRRPWLGSALGLLVQLGGNQSYEFIYFRF